MAFSMNTHYHRPRLSVPSNLSLPTWIAEHFLLSPNLGKLWQQINSRQPMMRVCRSNKGPSGFGSNATAEQVTEDSSCLYPSQLTTIITGWTSGIGAETVRVLEKRGVRVIITARDMKKAEEVKEWIQKETPQAEIILLKIDLSSFASIKRFCSEFLSLGLPLNILMENFM